MFVCLFCKIIKKENPCYKVYEDKDNLAFLDINPSAFGHTLIIPKKHFEHLLQVEKQDLQALILAVQNTAEIIQKKLNPSGIKIIQRNGKDAGQEIGHVHFHIIPCYKKGSDKGQSLEKAVHLLTK